MPYVILIFVLLFTNQAVAKEVHLDCHMTVDDVLSNPKVAVGDKQEYQIDIDFDNKTGKWGGWTSGTFVENPTDINRRLHIDENNIILGSLGEGVQLLVINRETLIAKAILKIFGLVSLKGNCDLVKKRINTKAKF